MLAHAPVEIQDQVLSAPLARFTPRTIVVPQELRQVLAEVRRLGYAVSDRQVTMDAVSVAAPIWGRSREVVAALSIVIRHDGVAPSSLVPAVQAAARGISRALGAPNVARPRPACP